MMQSKSNNGFLHEHKSFVELLGQIADAQSIDPYLVEKDYWLMHSLWGLQQQGWKFELKGGTSLSKGYQLIHRFSEDIDIRFEPPAVLDVKIGKNQDKLSHIESRRNFFNWLANQISIPGLISVTRDTDFDDAKYRNGGILLNYPVQTSSLPGVKEGILLEIGFDDTAPNNPCTISSWAVDTAMNSNVAFIDNRAVNVPCYSPAYTFVEKLQTVSTKFRMQQESSKFPKNFMRHYYDLYCLLESPEVLTFIDTGEYHARKKVRFRAGDNLDIATNQAFLLDDIKVRNLYELKYKETEALYYAGQVPFINILSRIQQYIRRL